MSTQHFDSNPQDFIDSGAPNSNTTRMSDPFILTDNGQAPDQQNQTNNGSFLLNGKSYHVKRKIASSGEAEVFLVEFDGKEYVLKYYFTNYRPKEEIIQQLQAINRQDILAPIEYGYYNGRFWETSEFMQGGNLSDILPLQDPKRFREIIAQLSEAIHACHGSKIIHRDVKPVNVFFRNVDRKEIVLADFGIASPIQNINDYRVTLVNRTSTYAAPELFTNINNKSAINNKVDYYALGISILEIWTGKDPFHDISEFSIMRIKMEGRVNIPSSLPGDIETLVKGLITTEPSKRWGYEEIQKWLRGEPVKTYYETHQVSLKPFEFDRVKGLYAADFRELAYYMEQYPQKAERHLYNLVIAEWVKEASPDLFSELKSLVEKEYPNPAGAPAGNVQAAITKAIYILDADKPFRSFDGSTWYSFGELAQHIESNADYFKTELKKPKSALYLFMEARGLEDRTAKYKNYYKTLNPDTAFNLLILDLQDNVLRFEGNEISNPQQLSNIDEGLQPRLLSELTDPHSKVSVWLQANYNYLNDNLNRWRQLKQFDIETLRFALGTSGLVIQNFEVNNEAEFYALLKSQPALFSESLEAEANCRRADYWLQNYQQSSLKDVIINNKFFGETGITFPQFKAIFGYLAILPDEDPYSITLKLANEIKSVVRGDQGQLKEMVAAAAGGYEGFIGRERGSYVFAAEMLEKILYVVADIRHIYPELAEEMVLAIDTRMGNELHGDFDKVRNNSESFEKVYQLVQYLIEQLIAPVAPKSSYLQHWTKEQQLIKARLVTIDSTLDQELKAEKQKIDRDFNKLASDYLKTKVDYLEKGKNFHRIFTIAVAWALALFFFYSAYNLDPGYEYLPAEASLFGLSRFWLIAIGIVILLYASFMVKRIRNRRPDTGIFGMICDPIHRLVGKLLYRPILAEMRKDPNSTINQKTADPKTNEIIKAENINSGKRNEMKFQELIRVISLSNEELQMELNKSGY